MASLPPTLPPAAKSVAAKNSTAKKRALNEVPGQKSPGAKGGDKKAATPVVPRDGLFFSRDESWLRFDERVLEEAQDERNPLLERVKFLAITASNLDEFVEIRVAGVLQRIEDGLGQTAEPDEGGMLPEERLHRISHAMNALVKAQYACWNDQLLPALKEHGVRVLRYQELSKAARAHADTFYADEVDPLLTPVTVDPSHPFPRVLNKALCLALLLRHKRRFKGATGVKGPKGPKNPTVLGVVTIPRTLPRLICLPAPAGKVHYIFLHELVEAKVEQMFRGYQVLSKAPFRVTRNSNLYLQEEESRSVLESVREELHNRRKGDAVRLEIEDSADDEIVERLRVNFELDPWQVFRTDGPVNLYRLMNLYSDTPRPALKYPAFSGRPHKPAPVFEDLFAELRKHDVLLHHPFDSYATVQDFISAGAHDAAVVSMKQTLYRTSKDSPIFRALIQAAESKEVTVVVELMARFDEDSNIRWARELEDAGVGVFLGIVGRKTHCKLSLLVRRDPDGVVRRYAHLGTGNYNPVTSRFYTDISLLTARPEMTHAVQSVFNYLTSGAEEPYRPLLVAPISLAEDILALIRRETQHARAGRKAAIVAKMNAVLDRLTVEALYEASCAGVEIDLIVRGMCALRPGIKGLSANIRVRSIIGQYLEHTRIFQFANGGQMEIYCGSADWMSRNLYDRCEVVFPVTEARLLERLRDEILGSYLKDTAKVRFLQADGTYTRPGLAEQTFSAQDYLVGLAR